MVTIPDSCDHRSPAEPRQWVTPCEKLLEIARNDPTFADCTAATPRWGTPPSRDGVEPSRLRLEDSTTSPRRRRRYLGYPLSTVHSTQSLASPRHPNQKRRGEEILLLTINTTQPAIVAQENYTLSATFSILTTFVLLLRQPLGGLPFSRRIVFAAHKCCAECAC